MKTGRGIVIATLCVVAPWQADAQVAPAHQVGYQAKDLKKLSIEELTQLDVTSASRRIEPLQQATAAIVVLQQEDLRRAGITSLPEAMRLATGVFAARIFGAGWGITARGFAISTANKMLVMIDGRTVYSPVFAGVFWEAQDLMLADIERIEVIRGPGGSLWGANAVNGIISVITKRAADTQGTLVQTGVGTDNRALAAIRHGGQWGGLDYRVYGQFRADDDRELVSGGSARDDLQFGQAGFRLEPAGTATTTWLLQGDLYSVRSGLADRSDTRMGGGNVLTRLSHQFSPESALQIQAYYDYTRRRVPLQYRALRHTFDVDVQQRMQRGRHTIVFGGGARASNGDDLGDGPGFFFDPRTRVSTLFSAFAQDEVALGRNRLFLTGGAKVERNDFSGVELQPTARIRWSPDNVHTAWGAVSRAVRMPTRFDTDLRIRLGNTGRLLITGSDAFESENVVAYEAGYRTRPSSWMSIDVAAFANRYTDLRSQELPVVPGEPVVLGNTLTARTSGVETSAAVQVGPRLLLRGSYSYLWKRFGRAPASRDVTGGASEANDPSHIGQLRASLDLPRQLELDATLWFASALPAPAVPGYAEMNLRLGWRPRPAFDLSIIGQHLLHDRHQEFAAGTPREYVARGIHVLATWAF